MDELSPQTWTPRPTGQLNFRFLVPQILHCSFASDNETVCTTSWEPITYQFFVFWCAVTLQHLPKTKLWMQHAVFVVRLFKYGNSRMQKSRCQKKKHGSFCRTTECSTRRDVMAWQQTVRSDQDLTLEVGIVPIPVLVLSVGKLGIPLAVRDPTKRCVIIEAGVEDLVHYLLRLLSADVPHC